MNCSRGRESSMFFIERLCIKRGYVLRRTVQPLRRMCELINWTRGALLSLLQRGTFNFHELSERILAEFWRASGAVSCFFTNCFDVPGRFHGTQCDTRALRITRAAAILVTAETVTAIQWLLARILFSGSPANPPWLCCAVHRANTRCQNHARTRTRGRGRGGGERSLKGRSREPTTICVHARVSLVRGVAAAGIR